MDPQDRLGLYATNFYIIITKLFWLSGKVGCPRCNGYSSAVTVYSSKFTATAVTGYSRFTTGKQESIGLFDTAEAAALALEEAELSGLRMPTKKRAPRGTVRSPALSHMYYAALT